MKSFLFSVVLFLGLLRGAFCFAAELVSGDVVRLETGAEMRLVAIHVVDEAGAKKLVNGLLLQKPLQIFNMGTDRRGRALAHLYVGEGKNEKWVQGELISHGLAYVVPQDEGADDLPQMLAREKKARASGAGLWANPEYADVPDTEAIKVRGAYGFVVGRVREVSVQKKATYLNFGENWRTDFSVLLTERARKMCKAKGRDPELWKGQRIRVRGFVDERNGPMIVPMRPEAIEALEEAQK